MMERWITVRFGLSTEAFERAVQHAISVVNRQKRISRMHMAYGRKRR